jgi:GTPase Era involved in 16S rRNA processing
MMSLPLRLSPPPLIAIAGMVNAGKSHFINRLIGDYLPSEVVSCTAVEIEVAWGAEVERYHCAGENRRDLLDAEQFDQLVRSDGTGSLQLNLPKRELLNLRLLDTPGFEDPKRAISVGNILRRGCHGLVWCVNFGSGISEADLNILKALVSGGIPLLGVIITKSDTANDSDEEHPKKREDTVARLGNHGLPRRVIMSARTEPNAQQLWRWLDEGARNIPTGLDAILEGSR